MDDQELIKEIEHKCERKLINKVTEELMKAQTSIFVASATCKVIVIRREDKSFLNVALKESIDRMVMAMRFKDYDRPYKNSTEVKHSILEHKSWIQNKQK